MYGQRSRSLMAINHGASAVGLVSAMPSGPGPIPEELIAEIASQIPPPIASFLLTSKSDAAGIIDQQRRLRVNTPSLWIGLNQVAIRNCERSCRESPGQ